MKTQLKGKNLLVLNSNLDIIKEIPISKLRYLRAHDVFLIMTSDATKALVQIVESLGIPYIAAKTFSNIPETKVKLISL